MFDVGLKVPKPGVLGLAPLPCSLWVPAQVRFLECVADPSPSFLLDLFFCRFLVRSLPEILDANSVWPVDTQEQEFVLLSNPCLNLYESLGAGLKSSAPTCVSGIFSIQSDMQQLDTQPIAFLCYKHAALYLMYSRKRIAQG